METTIHSTKSMAKTNQKSNATNKTFWDKAEFSRYGIISMIVLITGCLGGIAASFGANGDALQLSLIAFPTIITLAYILAVAPMKSILYLASLAVVLDLVVLIF